MKRTFRKEVFRSITHSFGRFLAILAIVALGAGFYSGLRSTAPDMRHTVDQYLDKTNMMDIQLLSTMGFTDDDLEAVRETEGVENAMAGYTTDAVCRIGDNDHVFRIHSLPDNRDSENGDYLNQLVLVEGRLPEKSGECVINQSKLDVEGLSVGDIITLNQEDGALLENLSTTTFTIVGTINSPYYISFQLGTSDKGTGSIDSVLYIPESDFSQPAYTEMFATVTDAKALSAFTQAYDDKVDETVDRLSDLGLERSDIQLEEIRQEAQDELDDAQEQYNSGKAEADQQLAEAKQKLDDAQLEISQNEQTLATSEQQLSDGEKQLADGWAQYNSGRIELSNQRTTAEQTLAQAEQQLNDNQAKLDESRKTLESAATQLAEQEPLIQQAEAGLEQLNQSKTQLEELLAQAEQEGNQELIDQYQKQLSALQTQIDTLQSQIQEYNTAKASYASGMQELQQGEAALAQARQEYEAQRQQTQQMLDSAQKKLDDSRQQLESTQTTLSESRRQLATGKEQLEQAKTQLESGWTEYNQSKTESQRQLEEVAQKITDGQKQLEQLEHPKWYVLDRHTNVGFESFCGDASRMESLSTVFPIIFFLVAALVALTTMTRMVEEERVLIGTFKALGYKKRTIMAKYVIYAGVATLAGCIVGVLICNAMIPVVCWNSYRIMYVAPGLTAIYQWPYILAAAAACAVCTIGATLLVCYSTLREKPAALMLPKAPKSGKRILLERIRPIWKRLKFTHKVTARNLFRYKKRLFMTIVGIAGCTALMLTGFGIKDSVSSIVSNQYEDIYQYNTSITLKNDTINPTTRQILDDSSKFENYLPVSSFSAEFHAGDNSFSGTVMVPSDSSRWKDFIVLRTRRLHRDIPFDQDSVVITEKLAKKLGVGIGDSVSFETEDGQNVSFQITGITEHYLYHYLYIAPELYEETVGSAPSYNQVIANSSSSEEADQAALSNELSQQSDVNTVSFTQDMSGPFDEMISSLDYIILILIVCAGLLAFVVLYNLTNINITERQRELATIKVLGFYDREVSAYIYRETSLLTILGCAAGLLLGVLLHSFVIQTVEVDMVMFGRSIAPMSFVYSALLTILFSIIVDLFMNKKLKRISMVESLKSVE